MSDDEYYAASNYDELEDLLWDADPVPDLADDLAEHAAYSPVWQDDPLGELEPYYSDWEYYSDDYYDDDPAILQRNPLDGHPVDRTTDISTATQKKGRKRKLDEARESFEYTEKTSLASCIQGTVWAQDPVDREILFQRGSQEEVALLADWRKLFKKDGSSHLFGKGQLKRDETWANDLSLSDMGLLSQRENANVRDKAVFGDGAGNGDSPKSEDEDEEQLIDDQSDSEIVPGPDDFVEQDYDMTPSLQTQDGYDSAKAGFHQDHNNGLLPIDDSEDEATSDAPKWPQLPRSGTFGHEKMIQNKPQLQGGAHTTPSTVQAAGALLPPSSKRKRSPSQAESDDHDARPKQRRVRARSSAELLDSGRQAEEPSVRTLRKSARLSKK